MKTHLTEPNDPGTARKPRRVFLWVFLAIQVLFLVIVITGGSSGTGAAAHCATQPAGALRQDCVSAYHVGTGIGVGILIGVWVFVDFFLGIVYGVYRLAKRP